MKKQSQGASSLREDRAVVNGAGQAVSALRASILSAGPDPRGGPSTHGAALGRALAALSKEGRASVDGMPGPCGCCAFRLGTMPNQAAATVRDALSALTDPDTDFMCHHALDAKGNPTRRCWGYEAARLAPFGSFKSHLVAVLAEMPSDEAGDPVRANYIRWLETADPDNRLDDYQRAALYAQAIEARRAETGTGSVEDESAVPKGCALNA